MGRGHAGDLVEDPVEGPYTAKAAVEGCLADAAAATCQQQLCFGDAVLGQQGGERHAEGFVDAFADVKVAVAQIVSHILQGYGAAQLVLNVGGDP